MIWYSDNQNRSINTRLFVKKTGGCTRWQRLPLRDLNTRDSTYFHWAYNQRCPLGLVKWLDEWCSALGLQASPSLVLKNARVLRPCNTLFGVRNQGGCDWILIMCLVRNFKRLDLIRVYPVYNLFPLEGDLIILCKRRRLENPISFLSSFLHKSLI